MSINVIQMLPDRRDPPQHDTYSEEAFIAYRHGITFPKAIKPLQYQ